MLRASSAHSPALPLSGTRDAATEAPPAASSTQAATAVTGAVRTLLRLEGLSLLVAALIMYERSGFGWSVFALYFLAPDLSFAGYLAGNRIGALAYNAAHSTVGPLAAFSAGLLLASPALEIAGLIWCAHIGFDRALGYGLKYLAGFGFTHLGRIGRYERATLAAAISRTPA